MNSTHEPHPRTAPANSSHGQHPRTAPTNSIQEQQQRSAAKNSSHEQQARTAAMNSSTTEQHPQTSVDRFALDRAIFFHAAPATPVPLLLVSLLPVLLPIMLLWIVPIFNGPFQTNPVMKFRFCLGGSLELMFHCHSCFIVFMVAAVVASNPVSINLNVKRC